MLWGERKWKGDMRCVVGGEGVEGGHEVCCGGRHCISNKRS